MKANRRLTYLTCGVLLAGVLGMLGGKLILSVRSVRSVLSPGYTVQDNAVFVGEYRVQLLSQHSFRVEKKTQNFEDRPTFTILDRKPSKPAIKGLSVEKRGDGLAISTESYDVVFRNIAEPGAGFDVLAPDNRVLFSWDGGKVETTYIPAPGSSQAWLVSDSPRVVLPDWQKVAGAHAENTLAGRYIGGSAEDTVDFYVFLPSAGDYSGFRREVLKRTGQVPLPPFYSFGAWISRYHNYNAREALELISTFRKKDIPLDVFVLDTDWREGGGTGYKINNGQFPDMAAFTEQAHAQHVRLVLNDHPQAVGASAFDEKELSYRSGQLAKMLELGFDAWWYDRNWHASLVPPPGVSKEVWGMWLYADITGKVFPDRRPLVLSNVDGIDQGEWHGPSHPAAHRFPVWWTGDTYAEWNYLEAGIENAVRSGIERLMPYVSEDLGGHFGTPTDEFYLRSVEYGVFSPIFRLHSSGSPRYPWAFSASTEETATSFMELRYRLLPLIYSAAHRAAEDGLPLLRRCDHYWPEQDAARSNTQYLFGDDLLVAPIYDGKGLHLLPSSMLHTQDGEEGLRGEYFANKELSGEPALVRTDTSIDFNWGEGPGSAPADGLPQDEFSIRWQASLGPIEQGGNYRFGTVADDGIRLWIGDKLVIDQWQNQKSSLTIGEIFLEEGKSYPLRVEYYDNFFKASCRLIWQNLDDRRIEHRQVWIPPGQWQDVWTGERLTGPAAVEVASPQNHIPLYARAGGIVLTAPQQQFTRQPVWNRLIADVFLPDQLDASAGIKAPTRRELYEDDGFTTDYRQGNFRTTELALESDGNRKSTTFTVAEAEGPFSGGVRDRDWLVRFHYSGTEKPVSIELNGVALALQAAEPVEIVQEMPRARLLAPSQQEKTRIFTGAGESPASGEGGVVEVAFRQRSIADMQNIRLLFK